MKRFILIFCGLTTSLLITHCSSTIETVNLGPEERLSVALKQYEEEDYLEAIKELETIFLQFPASAINDDAIFYLGMSRFQRKEYLLAAYEFSKLIKSMPTSEFLSKSQFMLAECYYNLSPNYSLDQKYSRKAIEEYQAFIDFFPLDEKVAEAERKISELNNKIAKKEFETARIYEKLEYTYAALFYYDNIIQIYHDSEFAPLAYYNKINILLSKKRNFEALQTARAFLQNFPDNKNSNEIKNIIAQLENELSLN